MNKHDEINDKLTELRRQAEKRLAEQNVPPMSVNSLEDAQRLIAELQVHQIELEMQNDELRQTQAQLGMEREKYADLYNFAPVAYFIFDDRDLIFDLNLAAAELLGNERKYLVDHPFTAYVSPESIQGFVEHRQKTLETKLPQTCELILRPRNGARVYVQVRTMALHAAPNVAQLWRTVMTDITERKRAENIMQARLRITEFAANHSFDELLQNALDELCELTDSPIGFFHFVEPDQKTLSLQAWSTRTLQEFCTASGRGEHYDIDKAGVWVDCVREGHPVIHNDYSNLPHRKGLPEGHAPVIREMVFPIMRHQNIVAIIGVGNKPLDYTEDDAAYASHLADLIWDITERKRTEEALRASEERFRSLAASFNDVIYTLDTQQRHTGVYGDWVEKSGLTPEFFLGRTSRDIFGAESDHVHQEANQQALSGTPTTYEWSAPSSNGVVHYQTAVSPLRNSQGEIVGIVGVGRDITARKRAEEEIRQLNTNLEQRVEERTQELRDAQEKLIRQERLAVLGQMAGSVGHELRNPLGVISNSIYFLKMVQANADEKVKEYHDQIEKNIHIADKIITDLLDFTRIKSVECAAVSVPDLIQQALERFPTPKNVQVKIDSPADLPRAYADPQHVIQVLGNLVLNACQAMKDGGKLTVAARTQTEMIQIAVQDTGTGISPENMKKLFEPLFTTKAKGIGLGLAVCQKLVEANGGKIEVNSEMGKGSVFTISLPIYKSAA
jgi:PAS domain S-box-containing protein